MTVHLCISVSKSSIRANRLLSVARLQAVDSLASEMINEWRLLHGVIWRAFSRAGACLVETN
jgi:hypothetical protein